MVIEPVPPEQCKSVDFTEASLFSVDVKCMLMLCYTFIEPEMTLKVFELSCEVCDRDPSRAVRE